MNLLTRALGLDPRDWHATRAATHPQPIAAFVRWLLLAWITVGWMVLIPWALLEVLS